jgi:hypothetical protein
MTDSLLERRHRFCSHDAREPQPQNWQKRPKTPEAIAKSWKQTKGYVVGAALVEQMTHAPMFLSSSYLYGGPCQYLHVETTQTERVFEVLSEQWKAETAHISSYRDLFMHPAYQQIIGLGNSAVPLMLRDLQNRPHMWFWALHSITRENPVNDASAGNVDEMADAWLTWGRKRGLL